ncbi:MAG: ABC transporter ATP-binding protein [Porphyromonadaceae bacterium]|jgi:iron complex transport system ATP-binding protein|nr:ABC transporter ATP-binding protein [Porphyromonadaceae bacterium]
MEHFSIKNTGSTAAKTPPLEGGGASLSTKSLSIGYAKGKFKTPVQSDLNLELFPGEMVCLIGPNGSGKSTLMRTLSGVQKLLDGKIMLDNKEISKYSQKELALKIALVLTDRVDVENATVRDIVALGQHPYTHWLGGMSEKGKQKINEAIRLTHLEHKKFNFINELSDGEKQRVMIAKALAQDTPFIFLDEPTAHLDLPSRVDIMLLLHKLAHTTGKAILISTHELDLALQAGDRIWLMSEHGGVKSGVPEDLVLNGTFNRVFENDAYYFNTTNGNFSMNYPMTKKVNVVGDKTRIYWTFRALARIGISVEPDAETLITINNDGWNMNSQTYKTIESLLKALSDSSLSGKT